MNQRARTILWLDGGAACAAGIMMLALRDWLAQLYRFPLALVVFMGACNLAYASYSGTLAVRASRSKTPSRRAIDFLVAANWTWVAVCLVLLVASWQSASAFGLAQVTLEGLFVGSLAMAERRAVRPFAR